MMGKGVTRSAFLQNFFYKNKHGWIWPTDHNLLTLPNYQQVEKFYCLFNIKLIIRFAKSYPIILQDYFCLKLLSSLSSKCQSSILYYFSITQMIRVRIFYSPSHCLTILIVTNALETRLKVTCTNKEIMSNRSSDSFPRCQLTNLCLLQVSIAGMYFAIRRM